MNVTELARQVRVPTKKLRELFPLLGFDIGGRAIKVDPRVAQDVIRKLNNKNEREKLLKLIEQEENTKKEEEKEVSIKEMPKENEIKIPSLVVVKDLARQINTDVTKLVVELMRQGVMASLNDRIDFETASIIAEDFGYHTQLITDTDIQDNNIPAVHKFISEEDERLTQPRPPVVVVMGHVDHGKTTLLDAIRKTNVVSHESGGITQHIGAYQVEVSTQKHKKTKTQKKTEETKKLTFIDTPGHEAFSLMRSRGVRVADLAILVVAADDGVQPQTIEAISHIKKAELPYLVAINKIDKEGTNLDKIKKELSELSVTPEEWGGDAIMIPISAKKGTHISELLESLLLLSDMEKENIKANPNGRVLGTVIESHIDKGSGPVATILVRNGTLEVGNHVIIGDIPGKIKLMQNWSGDKVRIAKPSTPVVVLGLRKAPQVGNLLKGVTKRSEIKEATRQFKRNSSIKTMRSRVHDDKQETEKVKINIILKADVLGSLEALIESLAKLNSDDIQISVLSHGVGYISETDVVRAEDTHAYVLGFNAYPTPDAQELARTHTITLKSFEVIYDLLNFVADEASRKLSPEIVRQETGRLKVLKVFRKQKDHIIVGGKVLGGDILDSSKFDVARNGVLVGKTDVFELQSGKEIVTKVTEGQEAGLNLTGFVDIEPDDELVAYTEEEKERKVEI